MCVCVSDSRASPPCRSLLVVVIIERQCFTHTHTHTILPHPDSNCRSTVQSERQRAVAHSCTASCHRRCNSRSSAHPPSSRTHTRTQGQKRKSNPHSLTPPSLTLVHKHTLAVLIPALVPAASPSSSAASVAALISPSSAGIVWGSDDAVSPESQSHHREGRHGSHRHHYYVRLSD